MFKKIPLATLSVTMPVLMAVIAFESIQSLTVLPISNLSSIQSMAFEDMLPSSALSYLLMFVLFVLISIACIVGCILRFLRQPGSLGMQGITFATILTLVVWIGFIAAYQYDFAVSKFTYEWIREVYEGSPLQAAWIDRKILGTDLLALGLLIPSWLGVAAVVFLTALANQLVTTRRSGARSDDQTDSYLVFELRVILYALGAILISASITASIYFRLPVEAVKENAEIYFRSSAESAMNNAAEAAAVTENAIRLTKGMAEHSGALSLFWGAIFTLTLAMAIGVPFARLLLIQNQPSSDGVQISRPQPKIFSGLFERIAVILSPIVATFINKALSILSLVA